MLRSAVTVSLVPEAGQGPFVFHGDLRSACAKAAAMGFNAVEIFPPGPELFDDDEVEQALESHNLKLAAVGTGAGWLTRKLSLTDPDRAKREQARDFIASIIEAAGQFGAPAIVGSMQGRWGTGVVKEEALYHLGDQLSGLGELASKFGVPLFYEPLNRYETNLANTLQEGVHLVSALEHPNVKLLADLFHMNIEEADLPASIRAGGSWVGHIHLADSNRRPAGGGHTDFAPIAAALREIGYRGYVSAECFPSPDSDGAAQMTIQAFRQFFAPKE